MIRTAKVLKILISVCFEDVGRLGRRMFFSRYFVFISGSSVCTARGILVSTKIVRSAILFQNCYFRLEVVVYLTPFRSVRHKTNFNLKIKI